MSMEICLGALDRPEVSQLLREHLRTLAQYCPRQSLHALDLESLRQPNITFWSVWENGGLMGCGALKELDPCHGEIKSMRTAANHLRRGVAARLLNHILEEAGRRAYQRLSLETGSMAAFAPAQRLYLAAGFRECAPFADYHRDPNSTFMTKVVPAPGAIT